MAIKDVTHPEDIDLTRKNYQRLINGEITSYSEEKRDICKDGSLIWIHISVSLQRDGQGAPSHTIGILQDISQRKRLEADLRESERRWRGLTEALPQFIWTAGADGTADYFSTQIIEYTGRSENELLAWAWMDVLHPDDREPTRNSWLEAIAKQCDHEVEHRIRSSNGAYRWFTTRGVPIRDAASRIVKWFGTCTDITEHKRTEQALRESEQRWRSLTEALPQLVWTATPDGACDYFSMQWTQFTESRNSIAGLAVDGCIAPGRSRADPTTLDELGGGTRPLRRGISRPPGGWRIPLVQDPRRADQGQRGANVQVVRHLHGHYRRQACRGGVAPRQRSCRIGQPGQGRIPGQRQPRNPYAHERHPWHDGSGSRHIAFRRPAPIPENG